MYSTIETHHGHFTHQAGGNTMPERQGVQGVSNDYRASTGNGQHHHRNSRQDHQQYYDPSINPSSSSSTAPPFLGDPNEVQREEYQHTFTDADMAEFFINVGGSEENVKVEEKPEDSFFSQSGGSVQSLGTSAAAIPPSASQTPSSSSVSPALNLTLQQDLNAGMRSNPGPSRSGSTSAVGTQSRPELQHLQATPTHHSPFLGTSTGQFGSPLAASPTTLHTGSPLNHSQNSQNRQDSADAGGPHHGGPFGRSSLVPKTSDDGTPINTGLTTSRGPSPVPKLEAVSERGLPSPQDQEKDAETLAEKRQSNRFVYKLMKMVSDPESQHLISFNPTGTSVVVTNFDDFAKEVLPKHFKHSNFSSFIRQLNMYGFYKVNKTPRGQRNSNDSQIWEFSHPKFIKGRNDLLEEIRRKALDNDHARVEARDIQFNMSLGHFQLRHHLEEVQWRLEQAVEQNNQLREFSLSIRKTLIDVLEYIKATNGGQLPFDVNLPPTDVLMSLTPMMMSTPFMDSTAPGDGGWDLPPQSSPHPLQGQQQDGPSIFVTEPGYANTMGGLGPHGGMGGSQQLSPVPTTDAGGAAFSMSQFQHISPLASRRVSNSSSQSRDHIPGPDLLAPTPGPGMPTGLNGSGVPIIFPPAAPNSGLPGDGASSSVASQGNRDGRPLTAPHDSSSNGNGRGIASLPRRSLSRQNSGLAVDTTVSSFFSPDPQGASGYVRRGPYSAVEMSSSMFGDGMMDGLSATPTRLSAVPPSQRGQVLLQQGGGLFTSAVNTPLPPSPAPTQGMPPPPPQQSFQQGGYAPSPSPILADGVFGFYPPPLPSQQHQSPPHPQQQQQHQHPQHPQYGLGLGVNPTMSGTVSPHMMSNGFSIGPSSNPASSSSASSTYPYTSPQPQGQSQSSAAAQGLGLSAAGLSLEGDASPSGGSGGIGDVSVESQPNSKAMRTPLKRTASTAADHVALARAIALGDLNPTPPTHTPTPTTGIATGTGAPTGTGTGTGSLATAGTIVGKRKNGSGS